MIDIKKYGFISLGIALATCGFYFFNDKISVVTGGCGGLGIILKELLKMETSTIVFGLNTICLVLGFIFFGRTFFLKTIYASLMYPFFIKIWEIVDKVLNITVYDNMMFMVVMGSLFLSSGIAICLKSGGSTGGLDIIQKILHVKLNVPFSLSVYLIDGLVTLLAIIIFGFQIGVYSIIGVVFNGIIIDFIVSFDFGRLPLKST